MGSEGRSRVESSRASNQIVVVVVSTRWQIDTLIDTYIDTYIEIDVEARTSRKTSRKHGGSSTGHEENSGTLVPICFFFLFLLHLNFPLKVRVHV